MLTVTRLIINVSLYVMKHVLCRLIPGYESRRLQPDPCSQYSSHDRHCPLCVRPGKVTTRAFRLVGLISRTRRFPLRRNDSRQQALCQVVLAVCTVKRSASVQAEAFVSITHHHQDRADSVSPHIPISITVRAHRRAGLSDPSF